MTSTRTAPREQAVARYRWLAIWLPVLLAVLVAAIQAVLTDDLTATVSTHFQYDGTVDGWGPAWTFPVLSLLSIGGTAVIFWLFGLLGTRGGAIRGKPVRLRFMAALGLGAAAFMAVVVGLAAETWVKGPMIFGLEVIGAAVGVGAGWIAYRFAYDIEAVGEEPEQPQPLALEIDERAVWTGRCTMGKIGLWINVAVIVFMVAALVLAVVVDVSEDGKVGLETWLTLAIAAVVGVGVPLCTDARVRVDNTGLSVRSSAGIPRVHYPLEKIAHVEVTEVNPMGDFGGWGWRVGLGQGGWAVCLRNGEGICIARTNGKRFTVTVDDAATAVALLEGLRAKQR